MYKLENYVLNLRNKQYFKIKCFHTVTHNIDWYTVS